MKAVAQVMEASYPRSDRRLAARMPIRTPLTLEVDGIGVPTYTHDISRIGISFYSDSDLGNVGDPVQFTIEFPPEITLSTTLKVRCEGVIVRTVESQPEGTRFAAEIRRYQFVTTASTS